MRSILANVRPSDVDLGGVPVTASAEDYLKAIYAASSAGEPATVGGIAQHLGITAASVSGMLPRLSDQGLLSHEPYHGVALTEKGRRAALRTIRRHRVIESYLAVILGYPWDRVHEEAELLEHAASDELIDRMAQVLGQPATDPHGAPIPTRDGVVDETIHRGLDTLTVGESGRIVRVLTEEAPVLRYLDELALRPGVIVRVLERAPFGGLLTLEVSGIQKCIGLSLAAQVWVTSLT